MHTCRSVRDTITVIESCLPPLENWPMLGLEAFTPRVLVPSARVLLWPKILLQSARKADGQSLQAYNRCSRLQ
jgi:hypothetical protein